MYHHFERKLSDRTGPAEPADHPDIAVTQEIFLPRGAPIP